MLDDRGTFKKVTLLGFYNGNSAKVNLNGETYYFDYDVSRDLVND